MEKSDQDSISQTDDILVVDDSITSLQLLTEILTKEGYQVRSAERPQLAIESALAHPPSLILLDLKMLEVNGIEICRRLKQDERTREVPIIFLSALQDVQDRIHGFEAGGVDFINKPYHELEVLARVKTHLKLREMQLHLEDLVSERTAELKQADALIRKNEKIFRVTFEHANVGIAHLDQDGRYLLINQKFCDIVGYSQNEMLEQTFQDITHPDDLVIQLEHVRQILTGGTDIYSMEKRYIRKNGEIVWVNLAVSLFRESMEKPIRFIVCIKDISARKQAEETFKKNATRLQMATAATRIAHWDLDLRTNEMYFSPEWKRQLGYGKHEILNRFEDWESHLHPDDRQRTIKAIKDYIANRRADYAIEFRLRHKDGFYLWIYTRAEKQFNDTGRPCRLLGCNVDITERKEAERMLKEYQRKLKSLVSQLTITEETERRRIAADLHDHIGHSLSLARMQLKEILETQSELEKNLLVKDISNILLQTMRDTRGLIFELSSPSMNEIGLAAAISEWLEERIAKRYDMEIEFIDDIRDDRRKMLDENVRALLFRNVRELLTNVVKHSRADKVLVYITEDDARVKIVVEDDGVGFDLDTGATKNKQDNGFGLFSIRERMTDIGGSFDIQSEQGKGCRVVLTVPVVR